jgi:DNA-binding PadR family transcriptional regulator
LRGFSHAPAHISVYEYPYTDIRKRIFVGEYSLTDILATVIQPAIRATPLPELPPAMSLKLNLPSNPLALAVLALVFERPMHPYEMAATLKHRHKHESIKLRYGSLYTVIDLLVARGLITSKETSRGGKRPERTVYLLTQAGHDLLQDWMRELLGQPVKEFPQFETALSLLGVLPPTEAVKLLVDRALLLASTIAALEGHLAEMKSKTLSELAEPNQQIPEPLLRQKFPELFVVEGEYRLALIKAELAFVNDLVRRITQDGWGPVGLWREMQAHCEREFVRERKAAGQDKQLAGA